MKKPVPMMALLMAIPLTAIQVYARNPSDLTCNIGPVSKTYGHATWLVYACNDGHSVNIISGPGSMALPFVFLFHWENGAYQLAGVGTGNKVFTDAAFSELKVLTGADIERLRIEALASAHHR